MPSEAKEHELYGLNCEVWDGSFTLTIDFYETLGSIVHFRPVNEALFMGHEGQKLPFRFKIARNWPT